MRGTKTSISWIAKISAVALILITAFIMIPSTVISAPTQSSVLPSEKPSLWPNSVFENLPWFTQSITNTPKILPSRVFIIENRELVTYLPSINIPHPESTTEKSGPENGTVGASVIILPSRQIVVDEKDKITKVWSNTSGKDYSFYSLSIWNEKLNGVEHYLTPKILSQYNKLLGQLDWNNTGRVY